MAHHRGGGGTRAFTVAVDQENPSRAAATARGPARLLPHKTPAPSSRSGLADVKRVSHHNAAPDAQKGASGKPQQQQQQDPAKSTARPQSRFLLQDKTNKAPEGSRDGAQDLQANPKGAKGHNAALPSKPPPPSQPRSTSPVLPFETTTTSTLLPPQCLKTPSPNMLLVKQRAPDPTPGPDAAQLEAQRQETQLQQAAAQDAIYRDLPVEHMATNTAKEMEFSDEYLCNLEACDINPKDLIRATWLPTSGADTAFIDGDPPIAEFIPVDPQDLVCCTLPPSPELKPRGPPVASSTRRPLHSRSTSSTSNTRPGVAGPTRPLSRQASALRASASQKPPLPPSSTIHTRPTSRQSLRSLRAREQEQEQVARRLSKILGSDAESGSTSRRTPVFQFEL